MSSGDSTLGLGVTGVMVELELSLLAWLLLSAPQTTCSCWGSCRKRPPLCRMELPRVLLCVFRRALSAPGEQGRLLMLSACVSACPGLHQQQLLRQEGELESLASNHRYEEALLWSVCGGSDLCELDPSLDPGPSMECSQMDGDCCSSPLTCLLVYGNPP